MEILRVKQDFIVIVRKAAWAPLAVMVGHVVFAEIFGHEPYVDPVMHFSGGVAIAYFFRSVVTIAKDLFGEPTKLAADCNGFGLACAAAVVWEIGEFFSDKFLGTNVQISNANTMRDLILGVLGASLFIVGRRLRS